MDATLSETDLFNGQPLPDAELTIGQDFYDEDHDENDSSYREVADPLSKAVGTPGYVERHMVHDCRLVLSDGASTEPEEFDRYYVPPGDRPYEGPAPILIDILTTDEPADQRREMEEKNVEFKREWCAKAGVRYVVISDTDDLQLSTAQLRAKLTGETAASTSSEKATEAAASEPEPRKRGVQRVRA